ncbi:MAG: hypothetical protein RBR42_06695 [Desulfomicrobium sp.]|nr:hypothetical protein [Desulfomicrobium sp.]
MKITPEQLAAVQLQKKNTARTFSDEGFAQTLAQELKSGIHAQQEAVPKTAVPVAGLDQTLHTAILHKPSEQTVMNKMDMLLTQWEKYSQSLGRSQGSLREGFGLLTAIRQNIQAVKEDLDSNPNVGEKLQTMVAELDILTTTEEFKFNRGDYFI